MSIRFRCDCGHAIKVPGAYAGKRVKCPKCGAALKVPAAAAPAPAFVEAPDSDVSLLAQQLEEMGMEAPPPPSTGPTRCVNCGKQLSAGARICITCGYDQQTGQGLTTSKAAVKGRVIAATNERPPWFSLFGIEFTTLKLLIFGIIVGGLLGVYFAILQPAKVSRTTYSALVKQHEGRLLHVVNVKLRELGPEESLILALNFAEPMFMLQVPPELDFTAIVSDQRTTLTVDSLSGSYDYRTGKLKLRIPNRMGGAKLEVTTDLPPDADPKLIVAATPPPAVKPAPSPGPGPTAAPGSDPANAPGPAAPPPPQIDNEPLPNATLWELGGDADGWVVNVQLTPWPARAGAPLRLVVSAGMSSLKNPYDGKLYYRLANEEASTAAWIELKQTQAPTEEIPAVFEGDVTLPPGRTFVQLKVQRSVDELPLELTDWSVIIDPG